MPPLHVAIVWHMHQPYYRQPDSDMAMLPWVRLHAAKDYLHMAQMVAAYPDVHVTFTLVPSLAEQLADYAAGRLQDRLMTLARGETFSTDDKRYLLNVCFSIQWDNIIRRHPPYASLLDRRPLALLDPDHFSAQDYRDLIVWFNLAWTDPNLLEHDPMLRGLVQKGSGFSVADATALIERHLAIVGEVLPAYRQLQDQGQIEAVTVPYFHPILPLLIHSDTSQRATPGLPLPSRAFAWPEDAAAQIADAVAAHAAHLGARPAGMWPSEGAIAPEMLALAAQHGLRWLASDEAILARSLNPHFDRHHHLRHPDLLYRPYRAHTEHGDVALVFRDRDLSDRIGFAYRHMHGERAAEDMIMRLKRIQHELRDQPQPGLVCIILDGENAWEHYEHNGDVFLHALYGRLQADPDLCAVTVAEHLAVYPATASLPDLATGSWIHADLTTWIGNPEQNEAWRRLAAARATFAQWLTSDPPPESVARARRYLFSAEGSDWFWWYSHHNSSEQDALFDQGFLDLLRAAYKAMGLAPPVADLTTILGRH